MELARAGMKFCEIAVLVRSRSAADRTLRQSFDQAGLPSWSPNGIPLREGRAGRSILLMLDVVRGDYARRDFMELLTFADIDFKAISGLSDPPTAIWDRLTMQAGIVRGQDQWLRRLTSLQRRIIRVSQEREKSDAGVKPVDLAVDPSVVATLIQTVKAVFHWLDAIARSHTWGELIDRTSQAFQTLIRAGADRADILEALLELRRLERLKPGPQLGLLARLLDETLSSESSKQSDRNADGVTLSPLMQARGVPFRAVLIPGLIERAFPQAPSVDPILLDHERHKLNHAFAELFERPEGNSTFSSDLRNAERISNNLITMALPPLLPLKQNQVAEERLLFRLAVGAAREQVVLTFPRIEAESGRERVPSYFLMRTVDAELEGHAAPVNCVANQPAPMSEPARTVQTVTSRRRRRASTREQLALPFDGSDFDSPAAGHGRGSTTLQVEHDGASSMGGNTPSTTLATMAHWPGFRHVSLSEFAPPRSRAVSLLEYDLGAALDELRGEDGNAVVLGACASLSPHFARGIVAERLRWQDRSLTRYDGRIEEPGLLALLRRKSPLLSPISPSRIEDYARCPFHFYMHNLLGLESLEEPELLVRSDPAAKGKLVHEILAEFLTVMKEQSQLPLDASHARFLLEIAERHLVEFEESGAAGPGLTWQVERDQLMKFFHQFIDREIEWQHQHGYRPIQFEMPFGRHDAPSGLSSEPARFDLGNGQSLQFRGIIDRVDISKDGKQLYVIDYKGRHVPDPGKEGFGLGTVVQLPIYLLGAQAALSPQGKFGAAGGKYISYQPDVDPVSIATLTDRSRERLQSILRTIAEGIHAGLFMQYTGQNACRYCPYDRVCMGIQDTASEFKKGDPAASDYLEMKGGFRLSSTTAGNASSS
jgi:ATP-dependent helicase/DNAse subunit B